MMDDGWRINDAPVLNVAVTFRIYIFHYNLAMFIEKIISDKDIDL